MRRTFLLRLPPSCLFAANLLLLIPMVSGQPQTSATPATFPNTVEGLKAFLQGLSEVAASDEQAKANAAFRQLEIPDAEKWFAEVLGAESGKRASVAYLVNPASREEELKRQLATIKTREREILATALVASSGRPLAPLEQSLLSARQKAELFYSVKLADLADNSVIPVGYFVQVGQSFRFLDIGTLQSIDPSKPLRIRSFPGGPAPKALHKPEPVYPEEARRQHVAGTVSFEAIVGTDGSVREVELISGNPLLVEAAREAVLQWSFEPPTYNGTPVEFILPIDLKFNLNDRPAANSAEMYKPLPATAPPMAYPEKSASLEKELRDLMNARKSADKTTEDAILRSFVLPDPEKWFAQIFGENVGKQMAEQYIPASHFLVQQVKGTMQHLEDMKFNQIEVRKFDKACDDHANDYVYPLLLARIQQAPFYEATFRNGNSYNQMNSFVFVDDAFRYVGRIDIPESLLFDELNRKSSGSPAPAPNKSLKLGGNVTAGRLAKRVPPVYPEDARRNYVQGTVRLLAVIEEDGSVGELRVAKGVCSLSKAAIDAVKKWKYQPFLINGQGVRVFTTIDTIFTLSH